MNENAQILERFYTAFQNRDYRTMQSCYADHAVFSDPVFQNLNCVQVRAMWQMFCTKSSDLHVTFDHVEATATEGSVKWIATYPFSATGRLVVNHIIAHFKFDGGKISQHNDHFDFYEWTRQALGAKGTLLGWTPLLQNKVRYKALASLNQFMARN